MNTEVENNGGSTETPTIGEPKKGLRKVLELVVCWLSYKDNTNNWLNEMRGNLSLIATVIATMTFQMALNPPGGVRSMADEAKKTDNANPPTANAYPPSDYNSYTSIEQFCISVDEIQICPGEAVLAVLYSSDYFLFLISNTISFIASLSICLLLVSGINFNHRFPMWLLSIGMCVTLTSLALSYITAVKMTTPDPIFGAASSFLQILVYAWMGLLGFIGTCLTLRLVIWGVKVCRKRNNNISFLD